VCEAFLRIKPHFGLWLKTFNVKTKVVVGQQAECQRAMVGKMPYVTWLDGSFTETVKGWLSGWFYITAPRDANWAAPRILIRHPHAAHLLEREGISLGCTGGAVRTPKLCQKYDKQENQACQHGPSHALLPDPSVSKTGFQYVGV